MLNLMVVTRRRSSLYTNIYLIIWQSGFGTVYEVVDHPELAMKIATASNGEANRQLAQKAINLKLLTDKGYPTVFKPTFRTSYS